MNGDESLGETFNYVLDTNVLLNDPRAIYNFKQHNVFIHYEVDRELEKFKKGNLDLNRNAREAIRILRKLKENTDKRPCPPINLPSGGQLHFIRPDSIDVLYKDPYADPAILNYINNLEPEEKKRTILVTDDNSLANIADHFEILAEVYKAHRPEIDNLNEILNLESRVDFPVKYTNRIREDGEINLSKEEYEELGVKLFQNQFLFVNGQSLGLQYRYTGGEHQFKELWVRGAKTSYGIVPRNKEQTYLMQMCLDEKIEIGTALGIAGTGKTIITLASALEMVLEQEKYKRIIFVRPIETVGGKEVGFLPGDLAEKTLPYFLPIYDAGEIIFEQMRSKIRTKVDAGDLDFLIRNEQLFLETDLFMRGRSLQNSYIIIDDAQNLTPHQVKTLVTRVSQNTKVIFTGDPFQIDNPYVDEMSNGLSYLTKKFMGEDNFCPVILKRSVRSRVSEQAARLL